ncbi:MAG: L-serine ammonia-lyase, partial [Pseudomonadota bacterium]
MAVSVFELFKIGIGPSSSHTVGPMRAARTFVRRLEAASQLSAVAELQVMLYGSLAHTGRGHGTDKAIVLGLLGDEPDSIDPDTIDGKLETVRDRGTLQLPGGPEIPFREKAQLFFNKRESLPYHPNGMRFLALDANGDKLMERDYYSVGGGFVVNQDEAKADRIVKDTTAVPYPFTTTAELRQQCTDHNLTISDIMWANEGAWRSREEIRAGLLAIHEAMQGCIERGCHSPGVLPGGLKVKRRAPTLYQALKKRVPTPGEASLGALDWVNLFALAVNEENAAGGRVVT